MGAVDVSWTERLGIVGLAALIAAVGVPLMRRVALRAGVVDVPDARRQHRAPMPLLGGVAITGAVLLALLPFGSALEGMRGVGILVGALGIAGVGLVDDWRGLSPALKLAAQAGAALVLLSTDVAVHLRLPAWANVALTLFWVIGITNAFNLLDNMDGLTGGMAAVASTWFLILAALNGEPLAAALAAAVLGACLGFLLHNWSPARIYMGDSGSLFLGFLLAAIGIEVRFPENVSTITWMVPVLVLGLPIFDTTLVVVSRLRRGRNPLATPGRDHVSHRLVRLGATPRSAVMLCHLVGLALGAVALLVSVSGARQAYVAASAVFLLGVIGLVLLELQVPASGEPFDG